MRKLLLSLLIFFIFANFSYASVGESFVNDFSSKLTIQSGKVIGRQGDKILLDKGANNGIIKGELVYIYKNLGNFIDPATQKTINLKEGRAYAQVETVEPNRSVAKIIRGTEKVQKYFLGLPLIPNGYKYSKAKASTNDYWQIGKSLYRIAIITRNPKLFDSLRADFESTKKFEVIDPDTTEIAMTKEKMTAISTPQDIEKLCNDISCDFVIPVYLKNKGQLAFNVYNGYTGSLILSSNSEVNKEQMAELRSAKLENVPPENPVPSTLNIEPSLTFWESLLNKFGLYSKYSSLSASSATMRLVNYTNIGYSAKALALAREDIVVANKGELDVYRFDGYSLNKIATAKVGYNIFSLNSATINGRVYFAISNFNAYGQLDSALAYIENNKIHIVKDSIPYAIRFFNQFKQPQLIAQNMSIGDKFYGPIYELNLDGQKSGKLSLPIDPASFFEFNKIGGKFIYATPNNEIAIYDINANKNMLTGYYISSSVEPIQRYSHAFNPNESYMENKNKGVIYIQNGLDFYKKDNQVYLLTQRSYRSNVVQVAGSHYNAYEIVMYKVNGDKLENSWNSSSISGRIVSFARQGDYIVGLIATPAPFFTRFILGEDDIYRLIIFEMQ